MCGRFTLITPTRELASLFDLDTVPDLAPRYNIAPTQPVAVVRAGGVGRELVLLRWGLVPPWARELGGPPLINAKAETVADKPAFRAALARRRCLIPADGFYEWVPAPGKKQPIHFRLRQGGLFAFAGLWERWQPPGGPAVESCAVLTTEANEVVRPVNERMPVILEPAAWQEWLDPGVEGKGLSGWLRPLPEGVLVAVPVSGWVNSVRNEGPQCLEPASGAGPPGRPSRTTPPPAPNSTL
jgi:putative SOS response-associated peptidase YedK